MENELISELVYERKKATICHVCRADKVDGKCLTCDERRRSNLHRAAPLVNTKPPNRIGVDYNYNRPDAYSNKLKLCKGLYCTKPIPDSDPYEKCESCRLGDRMSEPDPTRQCGKCMR